MPGLNPWLAQYYGYHLPAQTLGGDPPALPEITLTERQPPLAQHNLLDRALSSFGRPSLEAVQAMQRGVRSPSDTAWSFLTEGPFGMLGLSRIRPPELPARAAYRVGDDIFEGPVHAIALDNAFRRLGQDAAQQHIDAGRFVDGYVTNRGRFVSRGDATALRTRAYPDEDGLGTSFRRSEREFLDQQRRDADAWFDRRRD